MLCIIYARYPTSLLVCGGDRLSNQLWQKITTILGYLIEASWIWLGNIQGLYVFWYCYAIHAGLGKPGFFLKISMRWIHYNSVHPLFATYYCYDAIFHGNFSERRKLDDIILGFDFMACMALESLKDRCQRLMFKYNFVLLPVIVYTSDWFLLRHM